MTKVCNFHVSQINIKLLDFQGQFSYSNEIRMRKEIFFAIIAGGGLGLLIAFGIWRANVMLKPRDSKSTSTSTKAPTATSFQSGDLKIVIASPFNMAVLTQTGA